MLKAVIFDMDGVIIDSEPLHARANILALKKFGIDLTLDYVYQFIGNTILYMCETIKKDFHLDISASELSAESARQIAYLHSKEGYTIIPYVKELIIHLHQHGIKLAIASSSTMELIEKITDVFEIRQYFTALVSGLSVTHSKPAPDIFLKACEELNVLPSEALVIEDSSNGVLAAVRAKIPAVGYQNSHSGNQNLSKAAMIVEGFEEVDYPLLHMCYCHAHNLPATIATTKRLTIRELALDDVKALYELYQDDAFQKNDLYFASSYEEACSKQEAYIHAMYHLAGFGLWGVFLKDTNTLIGHCGIEVTDVYSIKQPDGISLYELGYGIKSEYQNQGYAKECLQAIISYANDVLYLNRLSTVIAPSNTKSINCAKVLGFSFDEDVRRTSSTPNELFHMYTLALRQHNKD